MAVIEGTRLRSVALPATQQRQRARRVSHLPVPTRPRIRPAGVLMAAILTATMLGLVYLTQTLTSNAASSELRSIEGQRAEIGNDLLTQRNFRELWAGPDKIAEGAARLGLVPLDKSLTLKVP